MTDTLYREIILEHWKNPLNYGVIDPADIDVTESNPLCGDEIRVTAKIKNHRISEIKFVAEGCAISKASASVFTEKIKNQITENLKYINQDSLLNDLGIQLTPARLKCALLIYHIVKNNLTDK